MTEKIMYVLSVCFLIAQDMMCFKAVSACARYFPEHMHTCGYRRAAFESARLSVPLRSHGLPARFCDAAFSGKSGLSRKRRGRGKTEAGAKSPGAEVSSSLKRRKERWGDSDIRKSRKSFPVERRGRRGNSLSGERRKRDKAGFNFFEIEKEYE
ncbi:hypothetical protein [Mailhella massiliensis]|uniref:hypothetical protein n=1 Tax=Mailhella massiliensis TaxID=1903261 RepID=UPI002355F14B|nr:hypothetical protein [Mailhella massiliensis]